jgi:hypothetical protein
MRIVDCSKVLRCWGPYWNSGNWCLDPDKVLIRWTQHLAVASESCHYQGISE